MMLLKNGGITPALRRSQSLTTAESGIGPTAVVLPNSWIYWLSVFWCHIPSSKIARSTKLALTSVGLDVRAIGEIREDTKTEQ